MTWKDTGINNATIHNFPGSPYIVKTALYLRRDKKIKLQFVFANENAARNYLQRQGIENLPIKIYNHN